MSGQLRIVVEKHTSTYVAYPIGLKRVVAGFGESDVVAIAHLKEAIEFHKETFGEDALRVHGQDDHAEHLMARVRYGSDLLLNADTFTSFCLAEPALVE